MKLPEDLLYTESHEWIKSEGSRVTVGITDYAQGQLKDIVYVEMPEIGSTFKKGDTLGVVESVKTVADLYSPVTGKIAETNAALKDHPQFVNEDPYGKGWMVKIEIEDREELKGLLSAKGYQGTLPEEG
ncbi:MAG TPA: glycine cleavage system protein GcvH [Thermodesulfobacteriota bacterium]|nr:glycine cleavage system protein GcvH [Thermodesulfobacteriota bacterium]